MILTRVAHTVILSSGWQRAAIAFVAGALSALAMAPFNAWPILFLTFPVAVWLIDGADTSRLGGWPTAALSGWLFGFGYFLAGLYWIGNAFLVDADIFGWLLPFAVAGLPAGLAVFIAAGFLLARLLWTSDWSRIIALAVALTAVEWLRGHILSGFPWNSFGYALSTPLALAQTASLIGLWGLTFLSIAIFASPAVLIDREAGSKRAWLMPALAIALLAAMGIYGAVRLSKEPTHFAENVKLRIMQPNLAQDVKFNYGAKTEVMKKYLALSNRASGPDTAPIGGANILIWPESAFPFFLAREADAMAQIADLLPQDAILITGAVRPPENAPPGTRVFRAYNSIYAINHDGAILSIYDKLHLVPFGEYLPFQSLLERLGFSQLTKVQGGFIAGTRRRPIDLPRSPSVLPLICYEAIFPNDILERERPGWIVNVTNDGWFGISPGPYQHLQQARLRAIEEGLPIVRAANTGVSAVIDPLGRIVSKLELGTEGVLDSGLPSSIGPTAYSQTGDIPVAFLVIAGLAIVVRRRSLGRRSAYRPDRA